MTRDSRFFLMVCAAVLLAAGPARADGMPGGNDAIPGRIQIEASPGVPVSEINARYNTTTIDSLPPLYLLSIPDGADGGTMLHQMSADSCMRCAEPEYRDETPEGCRQMVVAVVGGTIDDYLDQNVAARIHLADIQAHATGQGVLVAVIDTGIDLDHPALEGAIAPGGWDFIDNDADPSDTADGIDNDEDGLIDEGAGHGTIVAGIVHLVAPGARILPIRILDDEGRGTTFNVAKAIRYAVDSGASVINLSLGLYYHSSLISREIELASTGSAVLCAPSGNDDSGMAQLFPASDCRVLMIAALDSCDVKADFSNYHSKVAVSAPGVGIMGPYYDGGYAIGAGTSFSTPFIAGQCALVREMGGALTPDEVRAWVEAGVTDIYGIPGNAPYVGKLGTGRFDGLATWMAAPGTTGVAAGPVRLLTAPWPNPSRAGTSVTLAQTAAGVRTLAIYDAAGRMVRLLAPGTLQWDGRTGSGEEIPPGIYFARGAAGGSQAIRIVRTR